MENNKHKINLLTRADLLRRGINYSNTNLIEMEKLGLFPKRIMISAQRVAWLEHEVDSFIDDLISKRGGAINV